MYTSPVKPSLAWEQFVSVFLDMKKRFAWNSAYAVTILLWLVMCYMAWNFGYEVGKASVGGGLERTDRTARRQGNNYNGSKLLLQGERAAKLEERFPRPCQRTGDGTSQIVIFNTIPKCGGRTILSLTFALKQSLKVNIKSALNFSLEGSSNFKVLGYMNRVFSNLPSPGCIYTNTRFVALQTIPSKTPIRIGLIRDPMQRLVSAFYHARFGDRMSASAVDDETWQKQLQKNHKNISESFDDCVKSKSSECLGEETRGALVKQFCGYDTVCSTASPAALLRAKENVKNHYLLVGVLEEIDDFVRVLEKLVPSVFSGGFHTLENDKRVQSVIANSRTIGVESVSEQTKGIIKKHLSLDFEFYYFIQWRFMKQKEACGY